MTAVRGERRPAGIAVRRRHGRRSPTPPEHHGRPRGRTRGHRQLPPVRGPAGEETPRPADDTAVRVGHHHTDAITRRQAEGTTCRRPIARDTFQSCPAEGDVGYGVAAEPDPPAAGQLPRAGGVSTALRVGGATAEIRIRTPGVFERVADRQPARRLRPPRGHHEPLHLAVRDEHGNTVVAVHLIGAAERHRAAVLVDALVGRTDRLVLRRRPPVSQRLLHRLPLVTDRHTGERARSLVDRPGASVGAIWFAESRAVTA